MASLTFLPSTDAGLLAWSTSFSTQITATPTAFGLTAAQATAYAAAHAAYATAYAAATNESTRTKGAISGKNAARATLKVDASNLAGIVSHTATVTNQQKLDLGLNVRSKPSPIPAPSDAPGLDVASVSGWTVKVKLHDSATGSKRGKPAGVSGASVFSYVGATPPNDIAAWKFEGNTGRTGVEVAFDTSNVPGRGCG